MEAVEEEDPSERELIPSEEDEVEEVSSPRKDTLVYLLDSVIVLRLSSDSGSLILYNHSLHGIG